jgi:hypothetical protein
MLSDLTTWSVSASGAVVAATSVFLGIRLLQRFYFSILRGHKYDFFWTFRPKEEMDKFLKKNGIFVEECSFVNERDGIILKYRRVGTGKKYVLLSNGEFPMRDWPESIMEVFVALN